MKKFIKSLSIIILCLLTVQCTDEMAVKDDIAKHGYILFKVENIETLNRSIFLETSLSRSGYDTIFNNFKFSKAKSESSFSESLATGEWTISIVVKDSLDIVLYIADKQIEIIKDLLTKVQLIFETNKNSINNIDILIHLDLHEKWIDYHSNPVIRKKDKFDNNGISQPVLLKEENIFKMWYHGDIGNAIGYTLYAESKDGIIWSTKPEPVLYPGSEGTWDSRTVHPHFILKEDSIYKMYYTGWSKTEGPWYLGLATSTDGINWNKYPDPVLKGDEKEYQISSVSIIRKDNKYYMYYTGGYFQQVWWISLAISTDGVRWEKYKGNPILTSSFVWEGYGIYHPSVIENDGIYKMVYMGTNATAFGFATSIDGINWTPLPSNPFFTIANTSDNWTNRIAYPSFLKVSEKELRIYYSGIPVNSNHFTIAFIRYKKQP